MELALAHLENIRLFRSLSQGDLTNLAKLGKVLSLAEGETFIREGEEDMNMFAILEGRVEVILITSPAPLGFTGHRIHRQTAEELCLPAQLAQQIDALVQLLEFARIAVIPQFLLEQTGVTVALVLVDRESESSQRDTQFSL